MKYAAITSMNDAYFKLCGKQMLSSFKKQWSGLMDLHLYDEDYIKYDNSSLEKMGWNLGKDYEDFQERHANDTDLEIIRFAKKAFSIIHAATHVECDRLIWIDADVVLQGTPPEMLFDLIAPDDVLSTHFTVSHKWPSSTDPDRIAESCETGFFILNKNHPLFNDFVETYTDIYVNDRSDDLRRFYDGEVYCKTVKMMEAKGAKMMELSTGPYKTTIPKSIMHPYMTHHKGPTKFKNSNSNVTEIAP